MLRKPLRAGLKARPRVEDRFHERVAPGDDVADHPEIGPQRHLIGAVALCQLDAERLELLAHRRIDIRVAAGDAMPGLLRDRCDAAHECAADAEDVKVHFAIIPAMGRSSDRHRARMEGMRARIAAVAARIMAEDGIDDFALAKRKAARRLGAPDTEALPGNDEIEAELHAYRSLYQADEHPDRIAHLRGLALEAMRVLEPFSPYLSGPVLAGTAGPYAEIELQLFPESVKEVELFLLNRQLAYATSEGRRFSGDRARAVAVLTLEWRGAPLRLSVFDPRDERLALKSSQAGRVIERAGIAEVEALVGLDPGRDTEAT